MRELKFRAWDGEKMLKNHEINGDWLLNGEYGSWHVMQYTGLKDKNGVDIFEGDIVKWRSTFKGAKGNEHIDAIEWQNNHACFLLMPHVHEPYAAEMEVVGNIYQHKHLLK